MGLTAIEPSPTAEATRFGDSSRTSPTTLRPAVAGASEGAAVEDPGAGRGKRLDLLDLEPAVGSAGREDHDAGADIGETGGLR